MASVGLGLIGLCHNGLGRVISVWVGAGLGLPQLGCHVLGRIGLGWNVLDGDGLG